MKTDSPEATIQALLAPGKGILAADESLPTIGKRFAALGIPSTDENRRAYRELLFTAPDLNHAIGGAILFDETMRQRARDRVPLPQTLASRGIVPGIKVDAGTVSLPNFAGERITLGLDGLRERLAEYRGLGARFTKWRATLAIGEGRPTATAIESNAHTLALYAALAQEAGLVPIVEPEVLMDGNHSLAWCEEVMGATLKAVFDALSRHRVALEHTLLKTGMALPGKKCLRQQGVEEVATATLRCLRRTVPAAVGGIVFLSGGQTEADATQRLNAICRRGNAPWKLSFSFGRALQDSAMKIWQGIPAKAATAQAALLHRAHCNGLAVQGKLAEETKRKRPVAGRNEGDPN